MFGTLLLIAIVIGLVYYALTWNFGYWKKLGVVGPKPIPMVGNYRSLFSQKQHIVNDLNDIYKGYKDEHDFVGIFSSNCPQLLVLSPALAHRVFVTDFKSFHDNEVSLMVDAKSDFIFAHNPFSLTGDKWKETRAEIVAGLTPNRIKTVYPVTKKICKKMTEYVKKQIRINSGGGVDAKDLSLRFTSEVVTDCVLGLNADSFAENPTPILGKIKELFAQSFRFIFYIIIVGLFPIVKRFYKITFITKDITNFFTNLVQNAIDIRKSQVEHIDRIDFLNHMLQLQAKKQIPTTQVTSNTMTFLLDGFETTAIVISHCLLLLGRNPEIQEKLRAEIESHLDKNGEIEFDTLNELPYLDAYIHEAIRLFPPAAFSSKICTQPIKLTDKDGATLNLRRDDVVIVPTYSFMYDEEYYRNAQQFRPERFLENNGGVKKYREMGVYFGFGDGPRTCIGMRFALAQTKAAISEIIRNFDVHVNPKTRKDNLLDPVSFLTQLAGGVWLDFEVRT